MYIVKLTQLLRAFQISKQDGLVQLEPLHTSAEEPWVAYLHVRHGEVTTCFLHSKNDGRVLLQNTKALQWLDTKEGFVYTLKQSTTSKSNTSSALTPSSKLPKRATLNVPDKLHHPEPIGQMPLPLRQNLFKQKSLLWMPQRVQESLPTTVPRIYTRIFGLIDGHRTGEQIAALLHIAPERVLSILQELQAKRAIK